VADGFYKAVCDLIAKQGFRYLENAKGSHEKWQNTETGVTLVVPKNLKSRHTANGILKDAGVPKKL
jgi:predicted RNA binding protein YcfA (HicA-like mRNA interferase family)